MKFLSLQQSKAEENYQLLLQQVFLLPPLGAQFYFPHTTATPQTPPRPAMRRLPLQVVRLLPQVIRITHLPPRTQPAAHRQLLATAPNLMDSYPVNTRHRTQDNMTEQEGAGFYGDIPPLKYKNTLTIGFQNVGGVPTTRGKIKDDFIRLGINKFNFDIFGMAKLNVNWKEVNEEDKLVNRRRHWWESSHINLAYNVHSTNREARKFGGTAVLSIGKATHRIIAKGHDSLGLGRWAWTRYRGKGNKTE